MRIHALSDVHRWERHEELVDQYTPDVVALAGDLASDGGAAFWSEALEHVPEFAEKERVRSCEVTALSSAKSISTCK